PSRLRGRRTLANTATGSAKRMLEYTMRRSNGNGHGMGIYEIPAGLGASSLLLYLVNSVCPLRPMDRSTGGEDGKESVHQSGRGAPHRRVFACRRGQGRGDRL